MQQTLPLLLLCVLLSLAGCGQSPAAPEKMKEVGGPCEGCEAIFESTTPLERLGSTDSLPGFPSDAMQLIISGTIYQQDGKTPAPGIVLYVYHTDETGRYALRGDEKGWARKHGYIRGWIRTGADGRYRFITHVPASYPGTSNPKHIHPVVLEPGRSPYWLEEWLFDDDPLVTKEMRNNRISRGGPNMLFPKQQEGKLQVTHNIILGRNIPGY